MEFLLKSNLKTAFLCYSAACTITTYEITTFCQLNSYYRDDQKTDKKKEKTLHNGTPKITVVRKLRSSFRCTWINGKMQVSSSYTLYVFTQWLITILKILKVKMSTSFCQLGTTKPLQCKSLFHTPACKLTKGVGKASTTIKRNPLPFFNPLTNQDENSPRCGTQQLPFRRGNLGNLQSFLLCQYYKSIMSSSISNSCLLFFAKKKWSKL